MRPVLLVIAGPNGAGKTTLTARREELLAAGSGIAFETVFSSDAKVDFLVRAARAGYFIRVFFVSTSDPRINASRVANRVLAGGHTVPIEKILSRFGRAMANLEAAFMVADRVYVYDNSIDGEDAALCARTEAGQLRKLYGTPPAWVRASVEGLPRHPAFEG